MANVIARCIRLNQVPEKYKALGEPKRGATSIVYDIDDDNVYMLTRDIIKSEYLQQIGLAEYIEEFKTYGHHIPGMDKIDVVVLKMPKLYPLSGENKKLAKICLKEFESIYFNNMCKSTNKDASFYGTIRDFQEKHGEEHIFSEMISVMSNYDFSQFNFDLGIRNLMQDKEGRIVVVDPIISQELLDTITLYKMNKEDERQYGYGYR